MRRILPTFRHPMLLVSLAIILLCQPGLLIAAESDDVALFGQAVQLSEQGQWQQAARLFRDIAQRHPQWPEPKNNLAVAMSRLGQLKEAQQALEAAVSSQPSFKTAQQNRQQLYDYLAAVAYEKAIGNTQPPNVPQLSLLTKLHQPPKPEARPVPAQEPAPVTPSTTAATTQALTSIQDDISKRLQIWSRAWSIGDVETYLQAYSSRFRPDEPGTDYNQWRNIRRARLTLANNTQVVLQDIHIYLDAGRQQAIAEFVQNYRSDRYQDQVIKQLLLAHENNRWLILSERVIEKLN